MAQNVVVFGRLVQGQVKLRPKTDDKNQPVMKDGVQVTECYMGLAVPKGSDDFNRLWAAMSAEARAKYPTLFNAQGQCLRNDFAWKMIDGDGVDQNGKPYSDREGFAGHYVFKLATRYLPKCYPNGQYGAGSEMQEPDRFIKCGHYIRVSIRVDNNGVELGGTHKPGLFLSPDLVEHIAIGPEISSGPSAQDAFGQAGQVALPAGAQPVGPGAYAAAGGAPTPPAAVGAPPAPPAAPAAPAAAPGLPAPPAAPGLPAPPAMPAPPPAAVGAPPAPPAPPAAGPRLVVAPQHAAAGLTVENLLAWPGWTEETLVANGHLIRQ